MTLCLYFIDILNPLEVTNKLHVRSYRTEKFPGYGKWLIFRNLEDLEETWRELIDEVASGRLKVVGMKCSTLYYNPLRTGAGPRTTGTISVHTSEDDYIEVGMELARLTQHDIKYKRNENTIKGMFAHLPGTAKRITSLTIFWNDGEPYVSESVQPRTGTKNALPRVEMTDTILIQRRTFGRSISLKDRYKSTFMGSGYLYPTMILILISTSPACGTH